MKTENLKKIEVGKVTEIKTENGMKFKAFKAVLKSGKYIDLRFTKDCKNVPDHPCYIYVEPLKVNIDKNRKYPVMWVKEVVEIEEYPERLAEVADDEFAF